MNDTKFGTSASGEMVPEIRRLLLFDIDGTLIEINGKGRQVMASALNQVFGTTGPIEDYPFSGKTDLHIIQDLLFLAGIDDRTIAAELPEVYARMAILGETSFFDNGFFPCPGIIQLLTRLNQSEEVLLGLQTGNIRQTALLKLRAAGIDESIFAVGAYGSDAFNRHELVPIAWGRFEETTNRKLTEVTTIVIGDTPADIHSAHRNNCQAVAVATGTSSAKSLATHNPDFLFDDLSQTDLVLNILIP